MKFGTFGLVGDSMLRILHPIRPPNHSRLSRFSGHGDCRRFRVGSEPRREKDTVTACLQSWQLPQTFNRRQVGRKGDRPDFRGHLGLVGRFRPHRVVSSGGRGAVRCGDQPGDIYDTSSPESNRVQGSMLPVALSPVVPAVRVIPTVPCTARRR